MLTKSFSKTTIRATMKFYGITRAEFERWISTKSFFLPIKHLGETRIEFFD